MPNSSNASLALVGSTGSVRTSMRRCFAGFAASHFSRAAIIFRTSRRAGRLPASAGPHFAGLAGLREGLQAAGLQEGSSLLLEVRGGTGEYRDVESGAAELERQGVNVLVAFSTSAALAAQRATADVPIVFAAGSDPVAFRLVESIARPGGRLTGVHTVIADSTAKRFELLREIVPNLRRVVSFYNPTSVHARLWLRARLDRWSDPSCPDCPAQSAARAGGQSRKACAMRKKSSATPREDRSAGRR